MPYFLVSRTDSVNYDEYDAFVVKAKNEEDALRYCYDPMYDESPTYERMRVTNSHFRVDNIIVERLDAKRKDGPILGSFNAG